MGDEYSGYPEWKQWRHFAELSSVDARYFRRELAEILPLAGKRVVEFGFGSGNFLAFARDQGADIYGTELIPELLDEARKAGFQAGRNEELFADASLRGQFDLVMAFDVIEHFDIGKLPAFFRSVHGLLKPGGTFMARFPNGHSPFGRLYQNGDLTHRTAIGIGRIDHLAAQSGFQVTAVRNPRIMFQDNPLLRGMQVMQRGLRNLMEITIGYTYFNRRLPLDPNLVACLLKQPPAR